MTPEKQGEIALAILKNRAAKNGLPGKEELKRGVGTLSKETGIPKDDLMEFYRDILPQILGNMFDMKSVSITMSN